MTNIMHMYLNINTQRHHFKQNSVDYIVIIIINVYLFIFVNFLRFLHYLHTCVSILLGFLVLKLRTSSKNIEFYIEILYRILVVKLIRHYF